MPGSHEKTTKIEKRLRRRLNEVAVHEESEEQGEMVRVEDAAEANVPRDGSKESPEDCKSV